MNCNQLQKGKFKRQSQFHHCPVCATYRSTSLLSETGTCVCPVRTVIVGSMPRVISNDLVLLWTIQGLYACWHVLPIEGSMSLRWFLTCFYILYSGYTWLFLVYYWDCCSGEIDNGSIHRINEGCSNCRPFRVRYWVVCCQSQMG